MGFVLQRQSPEAKNVAVAVSEGFKNESCCVFDFEKCSDAARLTSCVV